MSLLDSPSPLKLLERGLRRIKQGKCEGAYATTSSGHSIRPDDDEACNWCALGALGAHAESDWNGHREALRFLMEALGVDSAAAVYRWSDTSSQAEVAQAFERAVELCKAVTP